MYGLVTPAILVPVVFVTPAAVDQYMLYEVAPLTDVHDTLLPTVGTTPTPVGAAGMVAPPPPLLLAGGSLDLLHEATNVSINANNNTALNLCLIMMKTSLLRLLGNWNLLVPKPALACFKRGLSLGTMKNDDEPAWSSIAKRTDLCAVRAFTCRVERSDDIE